MSDAAAIVREVEAFYLGYIEVFNREDVGAYLNSFSYPNAVLRGPQGMAVHATAAEQQSYYQGLMAAIRAEGWHHTDAASLQVAPLTETTAMLLADITRCRKDSTLIEHGRMCYTVRKDGGAWRILTMADVKLPFDGRFVS